MTGQEKNTSLSLGESSEASALKKRIDLFEKHGMAWVIVVCIGLAFGLAAKLLAKYSISYWWVDGDAAEVLVLGGVAMELYFHMKQFGASKNLDRLQERELAELRREVEIAKRRVAEAELETANLYTQIAWRHFTPEHRKLIIDDLRAYLSHHGKFSVVVYTPNSYDPEANKFADDIADAIDEAGFLRLPRAEGRRAFCISGEPIPSGIAIIFGKEDKFSTSDNSDIMLGVLIRAGLEVKRELRPVNDAGVVRLQIGIDPKKTKEIIPSIQTE